MEQAIAMSFLVDSFLFIFIVIVKLNHQFVLLIPQFSHYFLHFLDINLRVLQIEIIYLISMDQALNIALIISSLRPLSN
jgi:hypothetical protein